MAQPYWITRSGDLGQFLEGKEINYQLSAVSSTGLSSVTYKLQAGALPKGLTESPIRISSSGLITGIPQEVANDTTSQFTVRVTDSTGAIADRTFTMTIAGVTKPKLLTQSGTIGLITSSQWYEFTFAYSNPDPDSKAVFSIVSGSLPPGLQMSSDGRISGYAEPPELIDTSPTRKIYEFTVQLDTGSGLTTSVYKIDVTNYYYTYPKPKQFARPPVILNSQPLKQTHEVGEDFYGYYTDSTGYIGKIRHKNEWVWKIIGYDFDDYSSLSYSIQGLDIINSAGSGGGTLNFEQDADNTGWIRGTIPDIGSTMLDFYIYASVSKAVPLGPQAEIQSISRTDPAIVVTYQDHDLFDGSKVMITGSNPSTYNSNFYYARVIDSKRFELYSDQALVTTVDFSNTVINDPYISGGVAQRDGFERVSGVYRFKLTVVGDLDVVWDWKTPRYLGSIDNGELSHFAITANTNYSNLTVNYRIIGEYEGNLNSAIQAPVGAYDSTTIPYYWIVGDDGAIMYSDDYGQTVKNITPFAVDDFKDISAGDYEGQGILVAVGRTKSNNPSIYRTDNGIEWSPAAATGGKPLNAILYDNRPNDQTFIAIGDQSAILSGSQNGFLWAQGDISDGIANTTLTHFNSIVRTQESAIEYRYTIAGQGPGGSSVIYYSYDRTGEFPYINGITTSNVQISSIDTTNNSVTVNSTTGISINQNFITTQPYPRVVSIDSANNAVTLTSTDNLTDNSTVSVGFAFTSATITNANLALTRPIKSMAVNDDQDRWVAVGNGGMILISDDGKQWTEISTANLTSEDLNKVFFKNGQFYILGTDGFTAYSDSGEENSWSYKSSNQANDLHGSTLGFTSPSLFQVITGVSRGITTRIIFSKTHGFKTNDQVSIYNIKGTTELNKRQYYIKKIDNFNVEIQTKCIINEFSADATGSIIVTADPHGLTSGTQITFYDITGKTSVPTTAYVKVITSYNLELYSDSALTTASSISGAYTAKGVGYLMADINSTGYTNYISGGQMSLLVYNALAVGENGTVLYATSKIVYNPAAINEQFDEFRYDETWFDQNASLLERWESSSLGELPPNLVLNKNGQIQGKLVFQPQEELESINDKKDYYFWIQAYIAGAEEVRTKKQFYLTTQQKNEPFETIYIQAYPNKQQRNKIADLLSPLQNDNQEIPDNWIYRLGDPFFGRSSSIRYYHSYGIRAGQTAKYIEAISQNHYWRRVTLGPLDTAIARDSTGKVIYEVVYSKIIDNQLNEQGESPASIFAWPTEINLNKTPWYTSLTYVYDTFENRGFKPTDPAYTGEHVDFYTSMTPGYATILTNNSLDNMRNRLKQVLGYLNDDSVLPLWMTSQQENGSTLGFTPAWVICYLKPGYSKIVKDRINLWQSNTERGIRFNQIAFNIDRFIIDKQLTFDWDGANWVSALPSSQPLVFDNSQDEQIIFNQTTILPLRPQTG